MNFEQILKDLQTRASEVADQVDVDAHIDQAKDMARKVKDKIETDPDARNVAIGGAGLLALLLATKGGRNIVGGVAKTGAVAAIGALAWQAWQNRQAADGAGQPGEPQVAALPGYVADAGDDADFSRALIETMALAAHADGVIDAEEMEQLDAALKAANADASILGDAAARDKAMSDIASAAKTPNQASQLYAAACVATGDQSGPETAFLAKLADTLAIHPKQAAAIRDQALKGQG